MGELRRSLGLSQIEIAERLNVQQGAVSRMERRGDVKVSSLRDYCQSLGGDLRLIAVLPGGTMQLIDSEDEREIRVS